MSDSNKKAPTIPFSKLEDVAKSATEAATSRGCTGMVAVAAKRTVQWRLTFNSAKRKEGSKSSDGTFSVSKNVVDKLMKKVGVSYDEVMTEAYAAHGFDYTGTVPTTAPAAEPVNKAAAASKKSSKKASKKSEPVTATQADVDALVAEVLN